MGGGWRVIEVWESPEAVQTFFRSETARQAFEAAKIPPVQPTLLPVHTLAAVAAALP
jgi:quinol monooxygenase YgiN